MRRLARRLRRRFPSWRFTFVSLSLVGTMALAAVASWELHRSVVEHERSVHRSLHDYMAYAGRTFGEQLMRVSAELRLRATTPVLGTRAPSPAQAMELDDFAAHAGAVLAEAGVGDDPMRGYFRLDPRTGAYQGRGAAARPEVRRAVGVAIRERLPRLLRREEPALAFLPVGPDSQGVSAVWARQLTPRGETAAILGYTSSRYFGNAVIGAKVLHAVPVLPPSFISPHWHYDKGVEHSDSAISVEMLDLQGRTLYRSARQYRSNVRGVFVFRTNAGGFAVRTTMRPEVAAAITGAHARDGRRRLVVLLPLLSLLLGASAIVHLLRERELARAQRTFVASVSHELRTPLAQIRMFAETLLLRRERSDEERARWLGVITREARRLGDLVENILAFSHLEQRGPRLAREPVDLGALADDVAATYQPFAAARRVRITLDAPAGVAAAADPRALRQVLVNLLDNAIKYGPEGQTIRLSVLRSGDGRAALCVEDQGPGVAPAHRERLWQPFVRLGQEGGTIAGSGLGLAVVRSIVEQHGGGVRVEDAPGGGARFVVTLPLAAAASAAREPAVAAVAG